jgi:hypothetical protein
MKLNKDFLLHNTGSESILVPTGNAGFSGVVRGNKTLGAVLELLKEETTEAEIITALKSRFDAPEGVIEKDVAKALAELRRIGALDE